MTLYIDIYTKNEKFCAYIGEENSSGYECTGNTTEECISQISEYLKDAFNRTETCANCNVVHEEIEQIG